MAKRNQKAIDARQDKVNNLQDNVNFYQSVALVVYGICLLGIFIIALFAGVIK